MATLIVEDWDTGDSIPLPIEEGYVFAHTIQWFPDGALHQIWVCQHMPHVTHVDTIIFAIRIRCYGPSLARWHV